ncbi:hypothetical protein J3492_07695 [Psychrobacter sp. F1192]|uniref:Uncharacterized protein n=1 Tax=Psychrobacter coccoides TaxID=2818440 RepID=A0ABS3NNZ5_9GAMM|nr:hypothetical protein [Psychrobacter coccoides]MBO1531098.1 hypothetical protein [Psychrobacter coccoides]
MKAPRSKLASFLSLNQHRKRLGAADIANRLDQLNWDKLRDSIIDGDKLEYTYGSDKDLQTHLANLKREFVGHSELEYYHATLIVLIRRGFKVDEEFKKFEQLWYEHKEFLIQKLNTRWLISACDTFIDHSDDDYLKSLLMNAVILVNTIKMQESERYLTATENAKADDSRYSSLQNERLALFDGIAGFAVGTDDTLRNMRWRLDKLTQSHPLGGLLIEIFERVQKPNADTVYSRFRALHTRDKTAWWTE